MFDVQIDDAGFATIIFDMPDRAANVWNQSSLGAFSELLDRLETDESIKGAVITSAKKTFIAGADLEDIERIAMGGQDASELTQRCAVLSQQLRRLETLKKPIVAAINGAALGGGYELCLACHHRIAAQTPGVQVGLPEAQLGLLPGAGGTQRLPWLIGIKSALPLLMEGKQLNADKALKAGLVDQVVSADELIASAKTWLKNDAKSIQPWDEKGAKIPGGSPTDQKLKQLFMVATAMFQEKTYGNYPAGAAILSCIYEGLSSPFDVGLKVETRYFVSLLTGDVAPNMVRTLFLSLQEANKLIRRPAGVPKAEFKKIGVLGAGLMGAGISNTCAKNGLEVVLIDRDQDAADKGKAHAAGLMDRSIAKGRATEEKKEALLARIHPTTEFEALADCELVIEAVFEDRDVKAEVTKKAEAALGTDGLFASNTSTLPITGLAEASSRPENFIGLHFFSPVEKMPLIEVIRGKKTSDNCLAKILDFVRRINKTPIVVNDSRGFYTSRVFGTYITEGMAMLSEGIHPALIEKAGQVAGMPMPPLGLADEVGLALMHQVGIQTKKDLGNEYKANPSTPILEKMVIELERTGKRAGAGFYTYSEKGKGLWAQLGEHFLKAESQPSLEEVVQRYLYVQAIETARCMEEEVLLAAADADVGAIMGWGFAAYTGGPLCYIDTIGADNFVTNADALAEKHGERFSVPELLRSMATEGRKFYETKAQ